MAPSIGGVEVTDGSGNVRWAMLGAILVGGPLYAYFQGIIGTIQLFGGGVAEALSGVEWFLSSLVGGLFAGISGGIGAAWGSFLAEARFAGPLTFFVVAGTVGLTLVIVGWGVRQARVR